MTKPPTNLPVPDLDWYREIVVAAPETIIIIDRSGKILFHNDHAEGFDPASFVGKPLFDYFLPEYHTLVREKIEKVFQTGQMDYYELATDYARSERSWYMTRLGPIIRDGNVVAISLFIRDITDLKRAEQIMGRINQDLEKRVEERTRTLEEYAYRLEASEKLNAALRQARQRKEVVEKLARHSLNVLEADLGGVYLLGDGQLQSTIVLHHDTPPPETLTPGIDQGFYGMLRSTEIRFLSLEKPADLNCRFCNYLHSQQVRNLLVAPLRIGETVVGLLYLGFRSSIAISTEDEQLLNGFVESGSNTLHRIQVMEQLEQNVREREQELHVLYEITSLATESIEPELLLRKSLVATLKTVQCSMGAVHLADLVNHRLSLSVEERFPEELHTWLQLSGLADELWEKVYREKQVVRVRRIQTQSHYEAYQPTMPELTYLGIPIRAKEIDLGVLSILSEDERLLEPGATQLIVTIADQIGLALESAYQRKNDNETLILEERQRLARELHDSVSQSLYGLVLSADVGNKLLKIKAYQKLSSTLQEIGEVALQSLKEMRLMLFELRPLSLEAVGLIGALDLRLNTVERRAGMGTTLDVVGKENLPQKLELEIYRIVTEALNNSLKHAKASSVRVSIHASPERLEMEIADDGTGFESSHWPTGGIGLNSMRERATRIGGSLQIESNPDSGTRVCLAVPILEKSMGSDD